MESTQKKPWPPTHDEYEGSLGIEGNDEIHSSIRVPYPLNLIVDTPQFQRLRSIKQLGATFQVYWCADYHRFEHSMGVMHLADCWIKALMNAGLVGAEITDRDYLCVVIAALIHDLGHGPFSHTFDCHFLPACHNGKRFDHESLSIKMFDYLLEKNPNVKKVLDEYLEPIDYTFIGELIVPPKPLIRNGEWMPKGRPIEKSFLFDIVCNTHEGLDVDKLDYFLRDSQKTNCAIAFNKNALKRLQSNIAVVMSKKSGCLRIGYKKKIESDIISTMNARTDLHAKVYKHKTVLIREQMLVKALVAADPFLLFKSRLEPEKFLRMSEAYQDMSVYEQLTDDYLHQMILNLPREELKQAKGILEDLMRRQHPRLLLKWTSTSNEKDEEIKQKLEKHLGSEHGIKANRLYFTEGKFNQGLENDEPVRHACFFQMVHGEPVEVLTTKKNLHAPTAQRKEVFCYVYNMDHELRDKLRPGVRDVIGDTGMLNCESGPE